MNIDSSRRGSEMPSMPRWYRLWITSIHGSFTSNWSGERSHSKSARIAMPMPSVTNDVTSVTTLISVSCARE